MPPKRSGIFSPLIYHPIKKDAINYSQLYVIPANRRCCSKMAGNTRVQGARVLILTSSILQNNVVITFVNRPSVLHSLISCR